MIGSRWDCIVVGGGAAGLFAAGTAAERGRKVLVLEKNAKAGPKILMSGGTRCNVTHHCDSRKIAEAFGKKGRALLSPLQRMSPQDVVKVFDHLGVPTKVEETGKVFPLSDRAIDVRDALLKRLSDAGGVLQTSTAVEHVNVSPTGLGFDVQLPSQSLWAENVLITTGGLSFPGCGTTGDGYGWLTKMGHTITSLRPALTPLLSSTSWVHELTGVTLEDALVTATLSNASSKKPMERAQSRGGLLWTHFGLSGPTAMNVSHCFSDPQTTLDTLIIDLIPHLTLQQCEEWLLQEGKHGQRSLLSTLGHVVPKRLAETLLRLCNIPSTVRMAEWTRPHRLAIVDHLKRLQVPIHGTRGYAKAEVTSGGVTLGEVNFQDMQSRKVPGLYLAGEILDLDGPIGGFNFQAAWSTGHTAGLHL